MKKSELGQQLYTIESGSSILLKIASILWISILIGALVLCFTLESLIGKIAAIIVLIFLILSAFRNFDKLHRKLECFENGVICSGILGIKSLLYDDIIMLYYSPNLDNNNVCKSYRIKLNGHIDFHCYKANQEQITSLVNKVKDLVAKKMHADFLMGYSIQWGLSFVFDLKGLQYNNKSISYQDVNEHDITGRKYTIRYEGGMITGYISENNFLPGFEVLKRICTESKNSKKSLPEPMKTHGFSRMFRKQPLDKKAEESSKES